MTVPHKPDLPPERARIEAAGGHISDESPPRLDGSLLVSRALGDFEYKADDCRSPCMQKLSCTPDVYEVSGLQPGALCILGSAGVWEVLPAADVAAVVRSALEKEPEADLGDIAAGLLKTALRLKAQNNMTLMIVQFVDGTSWASKLDEMQSFQHLFAK